MVPPTTPLHNTLCVCESIRTERERGGGGERERERVRERRKKKNQTYVLDRFPSEI